MKDVAALAGVALKTVSRVMNDVPTVDPALAVRVRRAADELGYRTNVAASNLRRAGGRTGMIGLLVEDVGNPFSASLIRAVEGVARTRDGLLLTGSLNEDGGLEQHLARSLIDRRVDGLIIAPSARDHRWVLAEQQAGTAFVFVDRVPDPMTADVVLSDSGAAAADAVRHLMHHGHRRIAYLGDDLSIQTARVRYDAYCAVLDAAGEPVDPRLVLTSLRTTQDAHAATTQLLGEQAPTAFFASQNLILLGAVQALHEAGAQHRVALVGLDDVVLADLLRPAITLIAQDPAAIGRLAAQLLYARIDGDTRPPMLHRVPTRLVVRGSGEIAPPADG